MSSQRDEVTILQAQKRFHNMIASYPDAAKEMLMDDYENSTDFPQSEIELLNHVHRAILIACDVVEEKMRNTSGIADLLIGQIYLYNTIAQRFVQSGYGPGHYVPIPKQ